MNKEKKIPVRRPLGRRIVLSIVFFIAVFSMFITVFTYHFIRDEYFKFYAVRAQNTSAMIAHLIEGDRMEKYVRTGKKDDYYEGLQMLLTKLKKSSGAAYLYIFYPYEDHFVYLLEAGSGSGQDQADIAKLGDTFMYGETEYKYLIPDIEQKRASEATILGEDVGFGRTVSAWAPILDSSGNLAAMVEVDFALKDALDSMGKYFHFILCFMVGGILLLMAGLVSNVRRMIVKPVEDLTSFIASYHGEDTVLKKVASGDEIETLYDTYISMIRKNREYVENITRITAEKERISTELKVATQIQADMLPCIFPAFPERDEIDIYATMTPAKEVGGDFYDFFWVDERHLAMVMADVSGKGVPAALFMVIGKTLIKDHTRPGMSLGEVFCEVNRLLCESNQEGLFITAFECVLDLVTGETRFVNAGHEKPYIQHGGKDYEAYQTDAGFVLALMEDIPYEEGFMMLNPGDRVFLHTDGVTEATNADEKLYGSERLSASLNRYQDKGPEELLKRVKEDVDRFVGDAPQFDDLTMLCMEFKRRMRE